jgi:oxepin-CoA hydrolase/3-oxo-5,6-dehydrosuberyl-CoA semialdehyde dehydrogenase
VHRHPPRDGAAEHLDAVQEALIERLARVRIGNPREEGVQMGALASREQLNSVREAVAELARSARIVAGDPYRRRSPAAAPSSRRCCCAPTIRGKTPAIHDVEAFGPVSTIMPYRDLADAIALANRGMGSLALSLFTFDPRTAEAFVLGAGAYHGRMALPRRTSAKESTGHGSPLPVLVHGGPGAPAAARRLGGHPRRHPLHAAHRAPGQPGHARAIVRQWLPGAAKTEGDTHPFRKRIAELASATR